MVNLKRKSEATGKWVTERQLYHFKINFAPNSKMIIPFLGKTVNEYRENYLRFLREFTAICTICGGNCHHHCWYKRKVQEFEYIIIVILRVKCTNCGRTHAILPDCIFPKGRYSQKIRGQTVIDHEIEGKTQEQASIVQTVETTRRWIKRYRETIKEAVRALQSVLARLGVYEADITDTGLEVLNQICAMIETALNQTITNSGIFGKANIILSWEAISIWI